MTKKITFDVFGPFVGSVLLSSVIFFFSTIGMAQADISFVCNDDMAQSECYTAIRGYCNSVGSDDPGCTSGTYTAEATQQYSQISGDSQLFDVQWTNPLKFGSLEALIVGVLNALIIIAVPVITLMIIYGGFLYVTARGNAEQVKKATTTLTYAIIGGILVIGAVAITGIIEQTVEEFRS